MTWQTLAPLIWEFLNSPVGISLVAAVSLWAINKLYTAKPAWEKFEGAIIRAVQWAEREIPDNAENKHVRRADAALKYVLDTYETMTRKKAGVRMREELAQGIEIIHAEMETTGVLPLAPQKEPDDERNPVPAPSAGGGRLSSLSAGGLL